MSVEDRLNELGLSLPNPPAPAGSYVPWRRSGNLVFIAGSICLKDGSMVFTGKVGAERSEEEGYAAARVCILNSLAILKDAIGDLDKVVQVVMLNGFVNAVESYPDSPRVINGASDLLVEILGDKGRHARTAVSVYGLPLDSTVEVQLTVEVED